METPACLVLSSDPYEAYNFAIDIMLAQGIINKVVKMDIQFEVTGEARALELCLVSHSHGEVELSCQGEEVEEIRISGVLFDLTDDYSIDYNGSYYSVSDIVRQANKQLPDYVAESLEEEYNEKIHEQEMSSVYYTGRL